MKGIVSKIYVHTITSSGNNTIFSKFCVNMVYLRAEVKMEMHMSASSVVRN